MLLGQLKLARMSVFLTARACSHGYRCEDCSVPTALTRLLAQGATALLEALTATASAAAEGWMTRVTWLESFLHVS